MRKRKVMSFRLLVRFEHSSIHSIPGSFINTNPLKWYGLSGMSTKVRYLITDLFRVTISLLKG